MEAKRQGRLCHVGLLNSQAVHDSPSDIRYLFFDIRVWDTIQNMRRLIQIDLRTPSPRQIMQQSRRSNQSHFLGSLSWKSVLWDCQETDRSWIQLIERINKQRGNEQATKYQGVDRTSHVLILALLEEAQWLQPQWSPARLLPIQQLGTRNISQLSNDRKMQPHSICHSRNTNAWTRKTNGMPRRQTSLKQYSRLCTLQAIQPFFICFLEAHRTLL